MNDQTFEVLRKIRSLLWDAEYEMIINRDDLNFMDSEDVRYLRRLLSVTATQITDHIHTENGWTTDEV
jgi:Fe-S cluster biosynthesis and repair protein YggX